MGGGLRKEVNNYEILCKQVSVPSRGLGSFLPKTFKFKAYGQNFDSVPSRGLGSFLPEFDGFDGEDLVFPSPLEGWVGYYK